MKVFLSYSNLDKNEAGQIKHALEDYGLEVFLAHEDIQPSAQWVDRILAELEACAVFLPILTKNFDKSNWTDQEVGIALALKKLMIPLKITVDPYGFIGRFQALRIDINNITPSCHKLAEAINSSPECGNLFRKALIRKFGDSDSYNNAGHNTELLISFQGYTSYQVTKIVRYTIVNNQINGSYKSKRMLRDFIYGYRNDIHPNLYGSFRRRTT
ncbi:MAG: toll/interleukin-1 receptor domain-containing protein [bacterium]